MSEYVLIHDFGQLATYDSHNCVVKYQDTHYLVRTSDCSMGWIGLPQFRYIRGNLLREGAIPLETASRGSLWRVGSRISALCHKDPLVRAKCVMGWIGIRFYLPVLQACYAERACWLVSTVFTFRGMVREYLEEVARRKE